MQQRKLTAPQEPPSPGFVTALHRDRVGAGRGVLVLLLCRRRPGSLDIHKGADFIAAMAFQFASTNLVLELGIILAILIGWQFVAAEFAGGLIMIVLFTLMLRAVMTRHRIAEAKRQADRGLAGRMEGHAAMDMSVVGEGSILARITSPMGVTAISHYFVMDWASIWIDIVLGLLIASALAAWVPKEFWQASFLSADPFWSKVVGPLIGPAVAIVSFVCSVGNVPLAAVLWNGGISFGGVIAFLFADLIVLPILDVYRRYYGMRIALLLLGVSYAAMAGAAYVIEIVFGFAGLVPQQRSARVVEAYITWNYTTWLNIVFLGLAALLVWRFLSTGGPEMLRMMEPTGPGTGAPAFLNTRPALAPLLPLSTLVKERLPPTPPLNQAPLLLRSNPR